MAIEKASVHQEISIAVTEQPDPAAQIATEASFVIVS
jgi:hypothetical protein